jgi:hypothetical protein
MTDHDHGTGCGPSADALPELALGTLAGRERAQALSHVESCPRCAAELEVLSRAADSLVLTAPVVQPPMGFESRVFDRMGIGGHRNLRRWRPHWARAVAVAAVVVAAALGVAFVLTSSSPSPAPERTASAALVQDGTAVGRVTVNGPARSMSMTLSDAVVRGPVHCAVVTDDGVVHQVGTFDVRAGYGAWIVPLGVDPARVRTAELTSPSGTMIAAASFR